MLMKVRKQYEEIPTLIYYFDIIISNNFEWLTRK